jgi:soluble lytic murein transglycosylase-like protein
VQASLYDPVAQYAAGKGLGLQPGSPEARALSESLEATRETWGSLQTGRERQVVEDLLTKLKGGSEPIETGVLDAAGNPITRTAPATPVSYADLDAASLALTKVRGVSSARAAIRAAMLKVVEGTPAEAKLRYAGEVWKGAVRPAESLARKVAIAESPMKAFQAVMQGARATDPQRLRIARNLLDSASWSRVTGGFYEGLFRQAGGDGVKATRLWARVPAESQQVLDPSGRAGQLFQGLTGLARLEKGRLATIGGASAITEAGPQASAVGHAARLAVGHAAASFIPGGHIARMLAHFVVSAGADGVKLAGPAARMFAKGAVGSPAAARLSTMIVQWAADQAPETQDAAQAVAGALNGGEVPPIPPRPAAGAAAPSSGQAAPTAYAPSPGFTREMAAVSHVVGVDPALLHAVVAQESGGNPAAVSEVGAQGLMQVMPETFEALRPQTEALLGRRADIRNPIDNLAAGALLYRQHLDSTGGNVEEAARLYHGGPDPRQHGPRTQAYGRAIAARYRLLSGPARNPPDYRPAA